MFLIIVIVFTILGIYSVKSVNPVGFYSFTKPKVKEGMVKEYNLAVGKLFIFLGIIFLIIEIISWFINNDFMVFATIIAMPFVVIALICIYELKILKKYKE